MHCFDQPACFSSSSRGEIAIMLVRIVGTTSCYGWEVNWGQEYAEGSYMAGYLNVLRPLSSWSQTCSTRVCQPQVAKYEGY